MKHEANQKYGWKDLYNKNSGFPEPQQHLSHTL